MDPLPINIFLLGFVSFRVHTLNNGHRSRAKKTWSTGTSIYTTVHTSFLWYSGGPRSEGVSAADNYYGMWDVNAKK